MPLKVEKRECFIITTMHLAPGLGLQWLPFLKNACHFQELEMISPYSLYLPAINYKLLTNKNKETPAWEGIFDRYMVR